MNSLVRSDGQALGGEESLEGRVLGEGVWVHGEDVDLAGGLAPDQLTRGVVTEVQLRGKHEEVHWQPGPGKCKVNTTYTFMVNTHFSTSVQQILKHKLVSETVFFCLRFQPSLLQMEVAPPHLRYNETLV